MTSGHKRTAVALAGLLLLALHAEAQPAIDWVRMSEGIPEGERPHPLLADGDAVLAADPSGGRFFRTLDHGMQWEEVVAPSFAPYPEVWIVTSDGDYLAGHGTQPGDVHRSSDGGVTWAPLGVLSGPPEFDWAQSLLETPSGALLVGTYHTAGLSTRGQVYRSTDGGDTWALADTPSFWGAVWAIVQVPDGALYAAHRGHWEGGTSGITRSLDDGATWTPVFQAGAEVEVVQDLVLLPDGTLLAVAYLAVGSHRLLRSTDGETWELMPEDLPLVTTLLAADDLLLGYMPNNPQGVYASSDGGTTWEAVNHGLEGRYVYDLIRDAAGYLYAATDDSIYRSEAPVTTASEPPPVAEGVLELDPIHPNPTWGTAVIGFALDRQAEVQLVVLNVLGRHVATLAAGPHAAGQHRAEWNAGALAPGTYLVRLLTEHGSAVQRVSVVR